MYIDDGADQSTVPTRQQVADIDASMRRFLRLADSGGFAVDGDTGAALLRWAGGVRDWLDLKQHELRRLEQLPPMGGTAAAESVSQFVREVAVDPQGIIPQLHALRSELPRYERALRTAMANYRDTEDAQRDAFRRVDHGG